jgi:hypothetical protein
MGRATLVDGSGVTSEVNYIRNSPAAPDQVLEFVTAQEERSTMQTLPGRSMFITNARPLTTDLDREGFVLVQHASSVADFGRIEEDPDVDQRYVDEMTELLAQVTGADKVFLLGGGKKRYGESATEELSPLLNAKPARYPHADNTDASSAELIAMIGMFVDDIDLAGYSRHAMYNAWRAVSRPPQDIPLAVCDALTVRPEDEVTIRAVSLERSGEITHDTTGYRHSASHRWHYYPDMTRDEVLVFKAHDTDPGRSRRVPHTAFADPSCPSGVATRASVEVRALALFR